MLCVVVFTRLRRVTGHFFARCSGTIRCDGGETDNRSRFKIVPNEHPGVHQQQHANVSGSLEPRSEQFGGCSWIRRTSSTTLSVHFVDVSTFVTAVVLTDAPLNPRERGSRRRFPMVEQSFGEKRRD